MPSSEGAAINWADYANWPKGCAAVVSNGMATLKELSEFYSVRDVFLMLEIMEVDGYNQRLASKGA